MMTTLQRLITRIQALSLPGAMPRNDGARSASEWLAGLLIMMACSVFSPTWWLLSRVMAPYADLQALITSHDPLGDYIGLIYRLKAAGPATLFLEVIPMMTLCVLAGFLYYALCTWIGMRLFRLYVYRLRPTLTI